MFLVKQWVSVSSFEKHRRRTVRSIHRVLKSLCGADRELERYEALGLALMSEQLMPWLVSPAGEAAMSGGGQMRIHD